MQEEGNIESPYVGRDFVQFGKTKSVLNKGAQEDALLFNTPSVLSLEIIIRKNMMALQNTMKALALPFRKKGYHRFRNGTGTAAH